MTRDEHRKKCIEAMKLAAPDYMKRGMPDDLIDWHFAKIFDALHGIAYVVSKIIFNPNSFVAFADLTKPPKDKP